MIILAAIVLASIGLCLIIITAGWWCTVPTRLEHERETFKLQETAKLNAVTIQERQHLMLTQPLHVIDYARARTSDD